MVKKACKNCKALYVSKECPLCKSNQSTASWQGRIFILNSEKSDLAKKMNLVKEAEYAIKVR